MAFFFFFANKIYAMSLENYEILLGKCENVQNVAFAIAIN